MDTNEYRLITAFDEFVLEFQQMPDTDTNDPIKDKIVVMQNLMHKIYVSTPSGFGKPSSRAVVYFYPLKNTFHSIETITGNISFIESEIGDKKFNDFIFHIDENFPKWEIKVIRSRAIPK